ncbi:MAG: methyltransferase domain-containing protein, partial [Chloroflexota bacterium]
MSAADPFPAGLGPLETADLLLPWSGQRISITRPTDLDALLDRVQHDPEQNLPYWAELWPSGIALADAILLDPGEVAGLDVLEIGCGIGTTACAVIRAGGRLLAADYFPEALAACRANCAANGLAPPDTLAFNWRSLDRAIADGRRWPR